eukprot:scaffold7695_cov64-Phaeocystis_antarctica.AAC.1
MAIDPRSQRSRRLPPKRDLAWPKRWSPVSAADPARRAATRGKGQSAGKKIWRRLKKKPQNFPPPLLTPPFLLQAGRLGGRGPFQAAAAPPLAQTASRTASAIFLYALCADFLWARRMPRYSPGGHGPIALRPAQAHCSGSHPVGCSWSPTVNVSDAPGSVARIAPAYLTTSLDAMGTTPRIQIGTISPCGAESLCSVRAPVLLGVGSSQECRWCSIQKASVQHRAPSTRRLAART